MNEFIELFTCEPLVVRKQLYCSSVLTYVPFTPYTFCDVTLSQYLSLSHPSQWIPSEFLGFLANFQKCPNGFHPIPTLFLPQSHLIPSEFQMNSICSRHQYKLLLAMKYVCLHMFSSCDRHTTMIM